MEAKRGILGKTFPDDHLPCRYDVVGLFPDARVGTEQRVGVTGLPVTDHLRCLLYREDHLDAASTPAGSPCLPDVHA